jgi:hypothetical protein
MLSCALKKTPPLTAMMNDATNALLSQFSGARGWVKGARGWVTGAREWVRGARGWVKGARGSFIGARGWVTGARGRVASRIWRRIAAKNARNSTNPTVPPSLNTPR